MEELTKKDGDQLLAELSKKFYLCYEYTSVKSVLPSFISSFELWEKNQQTHKPSAVSLSSPNNYTQAIKSPIIHFRPEDLLHLNTGEYRYIPWETQYSNIFECILALQQKFDIETILDAFTWQDFEKYILETLDKAGFFAIRTFRFTTNKQRHEVDIIAREGNRLFFIDAKHWATKTASQSSLARVSDEQVIRIKHLVQNPPVAGDLLNRLQYSLYTKFRTFYLYPIIIVSNILSNSLIINGVPILSVFQWNEFLQNFPVIEPNLKKITLNRIERQKKLDRLH